MGERAWYRTHGRRGRKRERVPGQERDREHDRAHAPERDRARDQARDQAQTRGGRALVAALVGLALGALIWLWLRTLRLRVVDRTSEPVRRGEAPWVLAFFHGTQVPLLAWRRRRGTAVLVSLSRDGAIQARVMATNGMTVVRGSSSRGGVRGLAAIVRKLRGGGLDAAFAVDGPRGPYGVAQPGALACARHVGGRVVPIGSACAPKKVFERAWDRFALPWPFARAVVVVGPEVEEGADEARVAAAIRGVNEEAEKVLRDGE